MLLRSTWKTLDKFHIHKSDWWVFKFDCEVDRQKILDGGSFMIYGRPLILKHVPPLFEFGLVYKHYCACLGYTIEATCCLWNAQVLVKICSKIREPLCIDAMIGREERISYTRVLVEVDIARELVTEVSIKLLNGKLREQYVDYENLPKFCSSCQVLGHSLELCKKKDQY